jgi:hypothetical protein
MAELRDQFVSVNQVDVPAPRADVANPPAVAGWAVPDPSAGHHVAGSGR